LADHGATEHGALSKPRSLSDVATREDSRVALVTCARLPDLDPDDLLLRDALLARGIVAEAAIWDGPHVDWADYVLVVLRSPWDYPARREQFVAWARGVPALANPADVIAWNTDKRYLRELAAAGLPVVPTLWSAPGEPFAAPLVGEYVIKPAVSAGSLDTERYDLGDARQRRQAGEHLARLHANGRLAMVQPYLSAVDDRGETALIFTPAGTGGLGFSHAVRKGPMLAAGAPAAAGLYRPEHITARIPSDAEQAVARHVLAAVPGGARRLLYARVDLIPGPDGDPVLIELELTEPSLFLRHAPGAADRLADAIAARLSGPDSEA
jgi:hypothetical protein